MTYRIVSMLLVTLMTSTAYAEVRPYALEILVFARPEPVQSITEVFPATEPEAPQSFDLLFALNSRFKNLTPLPDSSRVLRNSALRIQTQLNGEILFHQRWPTVLVAGALGAFAYLTGNAIFSQYLFIPYIPGTGELVVFLGAMVGAGLGFLWFNTYPAQVFMGDVGALSLGAALGVVAVMVRQELVLFIMGGIFVLETVSVMLQVASFRLTGKRLFRMAPIHHHFELKGWPEPRVIVRFWIISVMLVLVGLATLKLR